MTADTLASLGVIYKRIPIDDEGDWKSEIDAFAKERGYKNVGTASGKADLKRDQTTVTPEGLGPSYEDKIRSFFDEYVAVVDRD